MHTSVNLHSHGFGVLAKYVAGVLAALRAAYASGNLTTVSELIHADLFSNFIQMAEHLLSEGYKDPAAGHYRKHTRRASAPIVCEERAADDRSRQAKKGGPAERRPGKRLRLLKARFAQ
jgi:hypothetical protein